MTDTRPTTAAGRGAVDAAAGLSRAAGYVNLMVAGRRLSRIGLREAAKWARVAAAKLDDAADSVPRGVDPE